MREDGGFGGCLFQILIILVILALIGLVDWSTVGNWAMFMLILAIGGFIVVLIGSLFGWLSNKNKNDR